MQTSISDDVSPVGSKFVYPGSAFDDMDGNTEVLRQDQVDSWRQQGFALIDGLFEQELVEEVRDNCCNEASGDQSSAAKSAIGMKDNGFAGILFPSLERDTECINRITLHPRLLTACSQLLGCPEHDMRLAQSELWPKCSNSSKGSSSSGSSSSSGGGSSGGNKADAKSPGNNEDEVVDTALAADVTSDSPFDVSGSQNQRMHIDGFNHYLSFPSDWNRPEAVAMIVYYDETEVTGGGTALVARQGPQDEAYHQQQENTRTAPVDPSPFLWTPGGRGDLPWINDKTKAEKYLSDSNHADICTFREKLYSREKQVRATRGTVLFYRLDTWHRGTPLVPGGKRRIQNIIYKRKGTDWLNSWNAGAARNMYTKAQTIEKLIAHSTPAQREVLGFPHKDDDYWTPYTLDAVKARYAPLGLQRFEEIEEAVHKKFAVGKRKRLEEE